LDTLDELRESEEYSSLAQLLDAHIGNRDEIAKALNVATRTLGSLLDARPKNVRMGTFAAAEKGLRNRITDPVVLSNALRLLEKQAELHRVNWHPTIYGQRPQVGNSGLPNAFFATADDEIRVVCDPDVIEAQLKPDPDWLGRLKYVGFHGAYNWIRWEESAHYRKHRRANMESICGMCISLLEGVRDIGTLVSLGPGSGELDKDIYTALTETRSKPQYIPVDISDALLGTTWTCMKAHRDHIPVVILGDFDEGLDFVLPRVKRYGGGPFVYMLLGNTFGNFDKESETGFLSRMRGYMEEGSDALLIHVGVRGENYTRENDYRYGFDRMDSYFRQFIAYALARRSQPMKGGEDDSKLPYLRAQEIIDDMESHIVPDEDGLHASAVPGTETIAYLAKNFGLKPVQIIHRYELESLKNWLARRGWSVEARTKMFHEDSDIYDAVLLLRKVGVTAVTGN
jgi:hypothetical protein